MGHSSNVEQGRGGPRILQMFQIQRNSDLPPESCENKSPITHTHTHTHTRPQEKRKMGPVHTAHSLAFSPAREAKWKSMWCSARVMLHVFVHVSYLCMCVCMCEICWVSLFPVHELYMNLVNPERKRICLWMFSHDVCNPLKDHL